MVSIDNDYLSDIERDIVKNTDILDIEYVNEYDGYYIVMDLEYIYLFSNDYVEIYKTKIEKLADNKNNYELVYRDNKIMYMDNYDDKKGVIFKYYDLYSYELIDEIVVGR